MIKYLKYYLLFYFIPAIIVSFLSFAFINVYYVMAIGFVFNVIYQSIFRKKMNIDTAKTMTIINIVIDIGLLLCFVISKGYFSDPIWGLLIGLNIPYLLLIFFSSLTGVYIDTMIVIIALNTFQWILSLLMTKTKLSMKLSLMISSCLLLTFATDYYIFMNNPSQKYKGHGFSYMNGYSSTDLSQYTPYASNSKLITLNEKSTYIIENEKDMPILDGAEACYPVYSAIAKAVYKDIDKIEYQADDYSYQNGKIVTFTNSSIGYTRLFDGEIDMFFGAKPSQDQLEEAKKYGVELEYTPIGKEGFVFFVNDNNPVASLSSSQIKDIYHGSITNWKEVGGSSHEIIAFQRPERSGSQSMMKYFMGDVSLKEPLTYEMVSAMEGIIQQVAQYSNEDGAIGYTFRYFLEGLHQEKDVKILAIDNIYPTTENIKSGKYPISTYLYCVTLKANKKESVNKLKDYLLSSQGQYIIEQTGYCALN